MMIYLSLNDSWQQVEQRKSAEIIQTEQRDDEKGGETERERLSSRRCLLQRSLTQTGKNIFLYCYKLARLYRLYTTVKQLFFSRLDGFSLDYAKGLF
jgi:hypothetical protein